MVTNTKQLEIFDLENRFWIRFSNIIDDEVYKLRLNKDEYNKLKIDIYRNTKINVPTDLTMISTVDVQSEISLNIREQITQFAQKNNISYQLPEDHYSEVINLKKELFDRKTRLFQNMEKDDVSRMSEVLYYFGGLEKRQSLGKLYSRVVSEVKEIEDIKDIIEESRRYEIPERTIEGSLYSRISRNPRDLRDAEKIYKDTYKVGSESLSELFRITTDPEITAFNKKIKEAEKFVRLEETTKAAEIYKAAEKMCKNYQMLTILSESVKNNLDDKALLNGILNKAVYHSASSREYTTIAEAYCEIAEYKRSKDTFKKAIYVSKDYKDVRDVFFAVGKSVSVQEIKCSVMRECMKHIKQNERKYLKNNESRKELAEIVEIYTGRNENTEQLLKDFIAEKKRLESQKEEKKEPKEVKGNKTENNDTVVIDGDVRTQAEAKAMGLGDEVKYDRNITASEMGKGSMNKKEQASEMGTETVQVEGRVRTMNEVETMNAEDKARYDKNISASELSSVEQKKEETLEEPVKQDGERNLPSKTTKQTPW